MSRRHTKRERRYWVHSDPDPAPDFDAVVARAVDEHVALDGAQACVLGCRARGEHLPHCPCQDTCADHYGHCRGCAPREARGTSLLCGSCFHRRLRSPIRQLPVVHMWLEQNLGGLRAISYQPRISMSADEAPIPVDADVHDHLKVMALTVSSWAERVAHDEPAAPPSGWDVVSCCAYLDAHASWASGQPWVASADPDLQPSTLVGGIAEVLKVARSLAPWEQQRTRLEATCDRCGRRTLVLYGGEDWVTCTGHGCDNVIGWARYQNLARAEARARSEKVG